MENEEQIKWAIGMWRKASHDLTATAAYSDSCERAAQSLELELQTGTPHCMCHMRPFDACPLKIKNSVLITR